MKIVTIEPSEFLSFVPDEIRARLPESVISDVCMTINNLRLGVSQTTTMTQRHFKDLTFCNCLINTPNNKTLRLNNHTAHHSYVGQPFTIYLTNHRGNRIVSDGANLHWHCLKDHDKAFPKCGTEFIKCRFKQWGVKDIMYLLRIHDNYVTTYLKTLAELQ